MALGIGCRDEEHWTALNECAVFVGKCRANGYLLQAVRQGPGVTDILELPHSFVIQRIVSQLNSPEVVCDRTGANAPYRARLNAGRSAQRPHHATTRG